MILTDTFSAIFNVDSDLSEVEETEKKIFETMVEFVHIYLIILLKSPIKTIKVSTKSVRFQ